MGNFYPRNLLIEFQDRKISILLTCKFYKSKAPLNTKLSDMLVWYHIFFLLDTKQLSDIKLALVHLWKFVSSVSLGGGLCFLFLHYFLRFQKYSIPLLTTIHLLHHSQFLFLPQTVKWNGTLDSAASSVRAWSFERSTWYLILISWIRASYKHILNNACLLP